MHFLTGGFAFQFVEQIEQTPELGGLRRGEGGGDGQESILIEAAPFFVGKKVW